MNQIQFYNSSIDLGFCPQMLKNYYNISQNETLITLITELKDNNIKNKQKSLNLGIKILVNIFDSSGRKLDLSNCKDNIKLSHNLIAFKDLNIQKEKNYQRKI